MRENRQVFLKLKNKNSKWFQTLQRHTWIEYHKNDLKFFLKLRFGYVLYNNKRYEKKTESRVLVIDSEAFDRANSAIIFFGGGAPFSL